MIIFIEFTGCVTPIPGQQTVQTTNKAIKVELLFEVDGCKVYRFYDGMSNGGAYPVAKYFTKCVGSNSVSWVEPCGKGCWREVENITAYTK